MNTFRYDLFLSHNKADRNWTKHLAQQIEGDTSGPPLHVFLDTWQVPPGSNLPHLLTDAIDKSRRIAFVLSPASVQSEWVAMEVDTAIARRDPSGRRGVLVPLLRADCDIPVELSHLSQIDFRRGRYTQGLRQLVDLLRDRTVDRGPGSVESVRKLAEDCDLIAAHRNIFLRPAFYRSFISELSLSELSTAVDDTVAALNTGAQYSRNGRLLARTETRGRYQTVEFIDRIDIVMNMLGELQRALREFDAWIKENLPGYSGSDDGDSLARATPKPMFRMVLDKMDAIDSIRNSIVSEVNVLLRIADERPLGSITPSSELADRLFGRQVP